MAVTGEHVGALSRLTNQWKGSSRAHIGCKHVRILITGGAGFIGSALIRHLLSNTEHQVLNLDKLTYAGNLESLGSVAENPRYQFLQADIGDSATVGQALAEFQPDAIMHLAAESHVDRSIDGPAAFIQTNIVGTAACSTATTSTNALAHFKETH